ncbi:MAG TPA: valine--tRNA ligase [Myxococcota bacterium]|nr:valine--tRNA ligase [Myxococcota bacterium]
MSNANTLKKAYEHQDVEAKWYAFWEEHDLFHAADTSDKPPYCIVIPPPNVTGSLHIGHALTLTIEDILIRHKRMAGFNTLWMPGTDHAGIATQMVVERELKKEKGLSRFDLGREKFIEEVWRWKAKYHARICEQTRALGASVDWKRERFTMDDGLSDAVRTVFVKLYEDGLIYRDSRLVNWSPGIHTVLSDLEVEYQQKKGSLWHIAYPVTGSDERLVVATTRPETMLGDTAVAVHPDDPRYQHLIGKTIDLPLTDRKIPIIADPVLVDMAFGSGAVKVTPAHDFNDFETGKRHGLPMISILDKDAKLNENAPETYRGLDRFEARKRIVADLEEAGLLVKVEDHQLNLGHCQRTGVVVEPMLSTQWYVRTRPLADKCIEAVKTGQTTFTSEEWTKVFFHWMENIKDWCISRQLWWGHQIPAWYCGDCRHINVATAAPTGCEKCGSSSLTRDEDVLDTWFSSGLWPFSTLGWPEQTPALKTFYPNSVMETGFDIIFFWVARMMMMGIYCMGEVPFKTVFLHPMVRDEKGQKMSKTKNNVIDPLDLTKTVGADALRFTLAALTTQGHDLNFSPGRLDGYRAFGNKIWNATRFIFMNLAGGPPAAEAPADTSASENLENQENAEQAPLPELPIIGPITAEDREQHTAADRWILHRLQETIAEVTGALDRYEFAVAANAIYQFVWSALCDWYIELVKAPLRDGGEAAGRVQRVLIHCLDQSLRLLHPFMPFLTEELWQKLPRDKEVVSVCVAPWPVVREDLKDASSARSLEQQLAIIGAIRNIRGENRISPRVGLRVVVSAPDPELASLVDGSRQGIGFLGNVAELTVGVGLARPKKSAIAVAGACVVYVSLDGVIDLGEEVLRLQKAIAKLDKDIEKLAKKLGDERFMSQAPVEVVNEQRARMDEAQSTRATYLETIASFSDPS